jgi:tripartite-type tricarboxylate transporter receptor subunit TctC
MANSQRRTVLQWGFGSFGLAALPVWAQSDWPSRAVIVIVPFPAGGGTDAFARPISAVLSKALGKQLVIDSRGGAGGNLGATLAARAAPDGYNWFMGAVHHAIAPSMYPNLEYSLEKDFIPIAMVARVPQVLVVNPKKVPGDFKAFLDMAKSNPGKLNYGSAGSGTSHHLAGELFKIQSNTNLTHIPYKGAGPALQGLLAGDVDVMFDGLGSSAQHIKAGRLNALMVAGNVRNPAIPEVPCAAELGFAEYNVTTWYGLWVPKGTPPEAQTRMLAELKKLPLDALVRDGWAANGAEFPELTGAEFGAFVAAEIKRWAEVVKASGAKLD